MIGERNILPSRLNAGFFYIIYVTGTGHCTYCNVLRDSNTGGKLTSFWIHATYGTAHTRSPNVRCIPIALTMFCRYSAAPDCSSRWIASALSSLTATISAESPHCDTQMAEVVKATVHPNAHCSGCPMKLQLSPVVKQLQSYLPRQPSSVQSLHAVEIKI